MAAEDAFITFNGTRVHVKVVEPDTELKYRVFVISSPMTSAFSWRKLTPELSQQGCMTVIMDLPGFGMSDCGENVPQDNETRAQIGWGIIDEVDSAIGEGDATWHIMAHGTACQTALAMANMYPDSVSSMIYISPMMNTENGIRTGFQSHSRWYDSNIAGPSGYRALVDKLFARHADDYVADTMRAPFRRNGAKESFINMLSQHTKPEPNKGFAPAMTLWGEKDVLMDEKTVAAFKKYVPESEIHVMKTAGHFPMETHSHAMRDYLRGWIKYVG